MTAYLATSRLSACPHCSGKDLERSCEASDLLLGSTTQTYEYARCRNCRVLFLATRPLPAEFGKIYPEHYAPYAAARERAFEAARARPTQPVYRLLNRLVKRVERAYRQRVDGYYGKVRNGALFLDFGCGAGDFLNRMQERGCVTIGMDFSEHSLSIARGNGHLALPATEAGWARIADGSLAFVRMNHVLEHLYEPGNVLRRVYSKMAPGALLHIAAPNPDGLSARLYGKYWHGLDCPRHAILFPPKTLTQWLRDLGFHKPDLVREPVTKDFIRSRALRARYRYGVDAGDIDNLFKRDDLQAEAAIPVLLAQLFGISDRFHVFAAR